MGVFCFKHGKFTVKTPCEKCALDKKLDIVLDKILQQYLRCAGIITDLNEEIKKIQQKEVEGENEENTHRF